jgi:hypothetical protein
MNKKKIFKRLAISTGILSLLTALLVGNIVYAKTIQSKQSKLEMERFVKAKNLEVGQTVRDLAIKTFDIDTNKYKPVFLDDFVGIERNPNVSADMRTKVTAAYTMLTMDENSDLKKGDLIPVFFFEENEVLIASQHADGTMSLTKYDVSTDVSKQPPIKTDTTVKEVK